MVNYMKDIANMLGVEYNTEFKIDCKDNHTITARIDILGLHVIKSDFTNGIDGHPSVVIERLLSGVYTIKCRQWKPKLGETYYRVSLDGSVSVDYWYGETNQKNYYMLGNCYPDQQSAETDSEKWIKFYASDEVLDI